MLQFNYNQSTNSNAIYPSPVTASVGLTSVLLDFTQSYDLSTVLGVEADVLNSTGRGNPWVVFSATGSTVPTASGQFDVNVWEFTQTEGGLGTWIETDTLWELTDKTWDTGPGGIVRTTLLATERAYVSGSNETPITQYTSPNENGQYYVYNG